MYRLVYRSGRHFDINNKTTGCSCVGFTECPWKWLSILKIKKMIKNDKSIFHAYIEDISSKHWSDTFKCGLIVWEWRNDQ